MTHTIMEDMDIHRLLKSPVHHNSVRHNPVRQNPIR